MERPRRLHPCLVLALAASLVLLACPNDPPPEPGTVATPTFSPQGGEYYGILKVYLACTTSGAEIYYTTDGSDPTQSDGLLYTSAGVTIDASCTLRARAYKDGMTESYTGSMAYTILAVPSKVPTPVLEGSASGVYLPSTYPVQVSPSCTLGPVVFVYTTDGTDPVPNATDPADTPVNGTVWTGGYITVTRRTTIKVIAVYVGAAPGVADSEIRNGFFDVFGSTASLGTTYGGYNAMTVDAAGKYHVAWLSSTGPTIKYSTNASGSWVTENALTPATGWQWLCIAVSSLGDVYIAGCKQDTVSDLLYITKPAPTIAVPDPVWAAPAAIDNNAHVVGQYVSMAIDSADYLHAAYYDANDSDLMYATNASGSWVPSKIDETGLVGEYCSLAIDGSDKVHISYYDATNGNLKYITNAGGGGWVSSTEDADMADSVGKWSAIAVDGSGKVHISYYEETTQDLKYATNALGFWVASTVDSTGNTGLYTSIAVEAGGRPCISYYAHGTSDVPWYAVLDVANEDWLCKQMLTGSGLYSHVVVDANDYVGVLYGLTFTKDGP